MKLIPYISQDKLHQKDAPKDRLYFPKSAVANSTANELTDLEDIPLLAGSS